MIIFDLSCNQGHPFEGWFDNAEAFEDQQRKGLVTCPVCGSSAVERRPSTFGIARQRQREGGAETSQAPWQTFIKYVQDNFEDVGPAFSSEALKMHYGVVEQRNIRGVSSVQQEELLRQEGVKFFKIPLPTSPGSEDEGET